jgi:hypothetical protein
VETRQQIGLSCETALRLGQPPAFGANEARLGARVVHPAILLGPLEETLCQFRALIEALGDQARCCGAKVDDRKLRRLNQTIEVQQPFGLLFLDEEELGHALVGGVMGWTHVEYALEAPPGARKVFREPRVFGVVHPKRAMVRQTSARLLHALARFAPLRFYAPPLRVSAHNTAIVRAVIRSRIRKIEGLCVDRWRDRIDARQMHAPACGQQMRVVRVETIEVLSLGRHQMNRVQGSKEHRAIQAREQGTNLLEKGGCQLDEYPESPRHVVVELAL